MFRKNALLKLIQPMDLDRMMHITTTKDWLILLTIGLLALLLIGWSIFGVLYENVNGSGLIVLQQGIDTVYSPAAGQVASINVEPGDYVKQGELVATLFLKEEHEEIKLYHEKILRLKAKLERIHEFNKEAMAQRNEHHRQVLKSLHQVTNLLQAQIEWRENFNKGMKRIKDLGAVSERDFFAYREQLDNKVGELQDRLSSIPSYEVTLLESKITFEKELLAIELDLKDTISEFSAKIALYESHSKIISNDTGHVTNILISQNEYINRNTPVIDIHDDSRTHDEVWLLYAYFNLLDGKKIRPGMRTIITPSTVKAEKEGSIIGSVIYVSPTITSANALNTVYHNQSFIESILKLTNFMPIEVQILLHRDYKSPSGFH